MIAPFGFTDHVDPREAHILVYPRVSSIQQDGNDSTEYQAHDFPAEVERALGINRLLHTKRFEVAEVEVESGADRKARLIREGDGTVILTGFARRSFLDVIFRAKELYEQDGCPVIIAASSLSRIGRSTETCLFLEHIGRDMHGNLRVWTPDAGRLLNPTRHADKTQLLMMIGVVSSGESSARSEAVRTVRQNIARSSGRRCLGERPFGYEQYYCYPDPRFEPIPVEELMQVRRKWSAHRIKESEAEIVRTIFRLAREGLPPASIVQTLNEIYGGNPRTGNPWVTKQILNIIRDPIYRGVKRMNKGIYLGGKRWRLAKPDEIIYCPYEEALRIVSDEEWYAANEMLEGHLVSAVGRRGGRYGKANLEALFYRTKLLRCALCGATMQAVSYKGRKYYQCNHRARQWGQPRCQTHEYLVIDSVLHEPLKEMFAQIRSYEAYARKELQEALDDKKRRALDTRLKELRQQYEENLQGYPAIMAKFDEEHPRRKAIEALLEKQEKEIEELQAELQALDNSPRVARHRTMLNLLSGLEAFDKATIPQRRALLKQLLQAAWIWPDGQIVFQWKGETLEEVQARSEHPLLIAQNWPLINFSRLAETTGRLMRDGEISGTEIGKSGLVWSWGLKVLRALRDGKATPFMKSRHLTILCGYYVARQKYLDMARLRKDVTQRIFADLDAGLTRTDIMRKTGMAMETINKIVNGEAHTITRRKNVWERVAEAYRLDLEEYRRLPEGAYDVDLAVIEEMLRWLMIGKFEQSEEIANDKSNKDMPSPDDGEGDGVSVQVGRNPETGCEGNHTSYLRNPARKVLCIPQPHIIAQLAELVRAAA